MQQGLVAALPKSDAEVIAGPLGDATVTADRGRLAFVFRMLIGYLLERHPARIHVGLRQAAPDGPVLSLQAVALQTEAADDAYGELSRVASVAREAAGRGLDTVMAVLNAHGANLEEMADGFAIRFAPPVRRMPK